MLRRHLALLLVLCAAALSACGTDDPAATEQAPPESEPEQIQAAPEEGASVATVEGVRISGAEDVTAEPTVVVPADREPPAELVTEDLVRGSGERIAEGDAVSVQYTGIAWSSGQKFDASWDRGAQPFEFTVGAGGVIPGWDQGVEGMRVGGRRLLVIPPDQAYGAAGAPPAIAPDETLVFVVDAVSKG